MYRRFGSEVTIAEKGPRLFSRSVGFRIPTISVYKRKSVYRSRGVLVAGVDVYSARRRAEWQKQLPSGSQARATRLYAHLDFLLEQKKQAEADLLREATPRRCAL